MERAKSSYAALALMLITSMPSAAQSVGELSQIQAETLILRAKAARAEAQASLTTAESKSAGTTGGNAPVTGTTLPNVKGVYGSGRLIANLLFADGSTMEVSEGDVIRGDFLVRTVSVDKVVLGRKGKTYPLGFSQKMPVAPERPQQSAVMGPAPAPFLPTLPASNPAGAP